LEDLISLLMHYGYLILLPLAVVEGPIISVIAGLLCAMKVLDPFIVVPVIVSGDVVGDSFYYGLGRWRRSKLPPHALRWFIPSIQKLERVRTYFDANPVRTLFLSKVILGIGLAGLYMAGNAKIPYKKFLLICLGASLCQCTVYVIIGFLFGTAYKRIGSLLNGFATFSILAALAATLYFFIRSRRQKI
jgi:membrane-associated protein